MLAPGELGSACCVCELGPEPRPLAKIGTPLPALGFLPRLVGWFRLDRVLLHVGTEQEYALPQEPKAFRRHPATNEQATRGIAKTCLVFPSTITAVSGTGEGHGHEELTA